MLNFPLYFFTLVNKNEKKVPGIEPNLKKAQNSVFQINGYDR